MCPYDCRMRRILAVLMFAALPAAAQQDLTTARLATLARIWGTARYAHPAFGHRPTDSYGTAAGGIDWDGAAVRAIDRTRSAASEREFADVVDEMLSALNDDFSRVEPKCVDSEIASPPRTARFISDGILYVPSTAAATDALKSDLRGAHTAIIDLRAMPGRCTAAPLAAELVPYIYSGNVQLPDRRVVRHQGYRTQEPGLAIPTYFTTYAVIDGHLSTTLAGGVKRTVFIVDQRSTLPEVAGPLAAANRGAILSVGRFHPRSLLLHRTFDLGAFTAYIRTSELIDDNRRIAEPRASILPADASEETILRAALEGAARRRRSASSASRVLPADYQWEPDQTYRAMTYPSAGYRVLAAFRLWNIIDLFYGYKHLIGDWNARLEPMIELMLGAASQRDYDLALAKIMTWVPDGHSWVSSPAFLDLRGRAAAPFFIMPVEGKPIVVEIRDAIATNAGVKPGDELVSIDGRPVSERIAELMEYISASTDEARFYYAMSAAPNGPANTSPRYAFRRPDGTAYEAVLARGSYFLPEPAKPWRTLAGNIGYVDLRYLETTQVSQMINELRSAKAIVFDIRNYPRGVFFSLGQRINTTGKNVISQIRIPDVSAANVGEMLVNQNIGTVAGGYTGKTIALIDERAQSQSEHTCLTLEAVSGTKFVGSHTVGANGNITHMVLPGSIYVMFTGMDVRHADGRQLQRIGIVPDYPVPRTQAAIAAGRDEVLEKALAVLQN
jgi:C-terminal processing protease CtpA/Prc